MKLFLSAVLLSILSTSLYGQSAQSTEDSLKNYFNTNKEFKDPIEGYWDVVSTREYYHFDTLYDVVKQPNPTRVFIIKKENKCKAYEISGTSFDVEFSPTDVKNVYLYRNYFALIKQTSESHAVINKSGVIEYTYDLPEEDTRIRLGNKYREGIRIVNISKWTKVP